MPRYSKLSRSRSIHDASIASSTILDFLAPTALGHGSWTRRAAQQLHPCQRGSQISLNANIENLFYAALSQASLCTQHQVPRSNRASPYHLPQVYQRRSLSGIAPKNEKDNELVKPTESNRNAVDVTPGPSVGKGGRGRSEVKQPLCSWQSKRQDLSFESSPFSQPRDSIFDAFQALIEAQDVNKSHRKQKEQSPDGSHSKWEQIAMRDSRLTIEFFTELNRLKESVSSWCNYWMQPWITKKASRLKAEQKILGQSGRGFVKFLLQRRQYATYGPDRDAKRRRFEEITNLPANFFDDILALKSSISLDRVEGGAPQLWAELEQPGHGHSKGSAKAWLATQISEEQTNKTSPGVDEQMKLLESVRKLEEKLEQAKLSLSESMSASNNLMNNWLGIGTEQKQRPITLTKEDYINLVDLYYYSHNSRFSPESTDHSPTPLVLDDYSFALSSDFSTNDNNEIPNEDEHYESPLKQIEEMLKERQLREVAAMQVFVDLLLDEQSSNRALFDAYKQLPEPGVGYLPKGILRVFMQRMSTPWTLSEKSMLRYLALIDDMQKANIPITVAEWSSAVYLAGRAFSRVTDEEVASSFQIWKTMEQQAGVQASHVTFNILFDIAVRAGKFALGETILKEMLSRNLRLNRLGRVSLMYYHGLRKDGDGVRKAYRDFVEAGEIVDTLVLNCVIASLLNAQEPQAAEQIYARMKNMQLRLRKGIDREGNETIYQRYPEPGENVIDQAMASSHLGRILEKAPHLQKVLPEHHASLQSVMPLTPNHITFRSMIAYHATTSGDLDRLTVLLSEMTDLFHLPLQTVTFQHLFKGFAIHGPTGGPDSAWSVKRLDLCWNACREAIKESGGRHKSEFVATRQESITEVSADLTLPSIAQVNALPQHAPLPNVSPPLSRPPPRRLSDWAEFVLDLAAFPRERLKRLERFHATMFDSEDAIGPHEKPGVHTYSSPFFQSAAYTAPETKLDMEEGEYVLPNPSESGLVHGRFSRSGTATAHSVSTADETGQQRASPHQVAASRMLVCWLLRAYARTTKSRSKVEEIWGSVRKLYKPWDATEREGVVRVLRRCLRDCDREGSG